jgi:hypothetical protein
MCSQSQATIVSGCPSLSSFVTRNLQNPWLGWPRVGEGTKSNSPNAIHALVSGPFVLEYTIHTLASRAQVRSSIETNGLAHYLRKTCAVPRIGGFVGNTVRAASQLGVRVSLCTQSERLTPPPTRAHLDDYHINRHAGSGGVGSISCDVRIVCADGNVTVQQGLSSQDTRPEISKRRVHQQVDLVLADLRPVANADAVVSSLERIAKCVRRDGVVGLRLNEESAPSDLPFSKDTTVWTLVQNNDVPELLRHHRSKHLSADGVCENQKTVVSLHERGALMLNGQRKPLRVDTCPVKESGFRGASDVLLAVTAISDASGADDYKSLQRGVDAATGCVAGLELPMNFDELDQD